MFCGRTPRLKFMKNDKRPSYFYQNLDAGKSRLESLLLAGYSVRTPAAAHALAYRLIQKRRKATPPLPNLPAHLMTVYLSPTFQRLAAEHAQDRLFSGQ